MNNEEMPDLLKKNADPEQFHDAVKGFWTGLHGASYASKIEQFHANTTLIDSLAQDNNVLYLIFDNAKFDFIHVGKNLEAFTGYTIEEVGKSKIQFVFKIFRLEHLHFFAKLTEASWLTKQHCPNSQLAEFYTFSAVGLSFKHKNGSIVRTMYRAYPLEATETDAVALQLFELRNITHLVKNNGFWMRIVSGAKRDKKFCYISNESDRHYSTDVISNRELEVLTLIAEGLSTIEIASQLYISPSTVEKHRKNMIHRLGARDTVALTEICKRVGIL